MDGHQQPPNTENPTAGKVAKIPQWIDIHSDLLLNTQKVTITQTKKVCQVLTLIIHKKLISKNTTRRK